MNIKDFTNGWLVGNFLPALVQTKDVEIGVLDLKAGDKGDGHFHKLQIEYNIILSGAAKIGRELYYRGDIFTFRPYEKSTVEYIADTKLLVIKSPATKHDKYY